jgi:hypothetical protein
MHVQKGAKRLVCQQPQSPMSKSRITDRTVIIVSQVEKEYPLSRAPKTPPEKHPKAFRLKTGEDNKLYIEEAV